MVKFTVKKLSSNFTSKYANTAVFAFFLINVFINVFNINENLPNVKCTNDSFERVCRER